MPGMRNPAHLQANPTLAEMWPAEGYHYRRDHFYESCCFQAALSRFCSVRRTVRPFVEPFTGPRVQKDRGFPVSARTSARAEFDYGCRPDFSEPELGKQPR